MAKKKKKGFDWKKFEKQSKEHYKNVKNKKLAYWSVTELQMASGICWLAAAVLDLKRTLDKFYKEGK
jgi:hypothetical protein